MPLIHPQLPDEVIQSEVLPRLPAKSVGRFRCVCKAWNSFLSTPDFTRRHRNYHNSHKLLLLDSPTRTFRTLDCEPVNHGSVTTRPIPFKDDDVLDILATVDGLLCVALKNTDALAFWNPLTGAYKKIRYSYNIDIYFGAFAFYKDSSNDYKLVHIFPNKGAFIYSRRLDSWRRIPSLEISRRISNFYWSMGAFLGDKIYFKLRSHMGRVWYLFSFDVESEKFMEIQPPTAPCGRLSLFLSLVALDGCIHSCVTHENINNSRLMFDLWRMDGDGWVKVAAFSSFPRDLPDTLRHIHIRRNGNWLAIWDDGNMKSFKKLDLEDFLTDYRFHSHRCKRAHEQEGAIYIETLVSPNA